VAAVDAQSRDLARHAVAGLRARGGTRIGEWLRLAHQLFAGHSAGLRHAILLTDGQNGESPGRLDQVLSLCTGVFSRDCRGVGTRWKVAELRKIAAALDGTVDIVADPAGLAADCTAMMGSSMSKQVADVAMRVWTPAIEDLTGRRAQAGPQTVHYPAGAWGVGECRDYHLRVRVRPGAVGQEMLAAWVSIVTGSPSGPRVHSQGLVRVIWTADEVLSATISPHVAHYTGQAELAQAIQDGLQARKQGDEQTATARLGRAVVLAAQSGHQDTVKLLAKVVDVVDAATGTIRLRSKVADADEMALDTRSTRTIRTRK
jgi:hypothetical protein